MLEVGRDVDQPDHHRHFYQRPDYRSEYRAGVDTEPGNRAARILSETLAVLVRQPRMQSDLARLRRACCEPQLIPAPTPVQLAMPAR